MLIYSSIISSIIIVYFIIIKNIIPENPELYFVATLFFTAGIMLTMINQRHKISPWALLIIMSIVFYSYYRPSENHLPDLETLVYTIIPLLLLIILASLVILRDSFKKIFKRIKYENKFNKYLITLFSSILILLILSFSSVIINLILGNSDLWIFLKNSDYWILFFILLFSTLFIQAMNTMIIKYYNETINLSNFSTYSFENYYRQPLVEKHIKNLNISENIDSAFLITFRVFGNKEEKSKLLNSIQMEFEDYEINSLFFGTNSNNWAIYIPTNIAILNLSSSISGNKLIERKKDDPYKKIQDLFKASLKKVNSKNVSLSASSTIYGIHSSDLTELIEKAEFMLIRNLQNLNKLNIITLYNHKSFVKVNTLNQNIDLVSKIFSFENLKLTFVKKDIANESIYIVEYKYINQDLGINKMPNDIKKIKLLGLIGTFKRMLALEMIQKYKDKNLSDKIMIPYSLSHIKTENDLIKLKKRIISLNIDFSKIIFDFSIDENLEEYIYSIPDLKVFLKKHRYNYSISNLERDSNLEEIIKNIDPNYLIFSIKGILAKNILKIK